MRRLAIFWLACAAVGFLTAVGVAIALSLALDGAAWRAAQPRVVQRDGAAALTNAAPSNAAPSKPQSMLASVLGPAA